MTYSSNINGERVFVALLMNRKDHLFELSTMRGIDDYWTLAARFDLNNYIENYSIKYYSIELVSKLVEEAIEQILLTIVIDS